MMLGDLRMNDFIPMPDIRIGKMKKHDRQCLRLKWEHRTRGGRCPK